MDILLGCLVLVVTLGMITALVLHSRRVIDRIARNGGTSARRALRDMHRED
jgi:hypothetical protein